MKPELAALKRRVNKARKFPKNTCGASRHVEAMARELLGRAQPWSIIDDPVHAAESMLATVAALWEARTALQDDKP